MKPNYITIKIGENTYDFDPQYPESLNNVKESDRLLLIELLEQLKQDATDSESIYSPAPLTPRTSNETRSPNISAKNMSKGDIDAMVATLMAEERSKRKSGLDQRGVLKIIGGVATVIVVLIIII